MPMAWLKINIFILYLLLSADDEPDIFMLFQLDVQSSKVGIGSALHSLH